MIDRDKLRALREVAAAALCLIAIDSTPDGVTSSELVDLTGYSKPSVSRATAHLLKLDLVKKIGGRYGYFVSNQHNGSSTGLTSTVEDVSNQHNGSSTGLTSSSTGLTSNSTELTSPHARAFSSSSLLTKEERERRTSLLKSHPSRDFVSAIITMTAQPGRLGEKLLMMSADLPGIYYLSEAWTALHMSGVAPSSIKMAEILSQDLDLVYLHSMLIKFSGEPPRNLINKLLSRDPLPPGDRCEEWETAGGSWEPDPEREVVLELFYMSADGAYLAGEDEPEILSDLSRVVRFARKEDKSPVN